jgi:cytidylate kinase
VIITIGGVPGAGDTTTSKLLAKKMHYKLLTIGEIYKEIAKKHGYASKDLTEFWKTKTGHSRGIHHELDHMLQKRSAKKEKNIVINGKMSAFHIKDANLKVFLTAPMNVRAKRIAKRDKMSLEGGRKHIQEREKIETKTWKKMYGFDYTKDLDVYDVVLNTKHWNVAQVVGIIQKMIASKA